MSDFVFNLENKSADNCAICNAEMLQRFSAEYYYFKPFLQTLKQSGFFIFNITPAVICSPDVPRSL